MASGNDDTPLVIATIYESGDTVIPNVPVTFGDLFDNSSGRDGSGSCPRYLGDTYDKHSVSTGTDKPILSAAWNDAGRGGMWPISSIVSCLHDTPIPPSGVNGVDIFDGNAVTSSLTHDEIYSPSTIYPSNYEPVITSTGLGNYEYDRPSTGSGDDNARESVPSTTPITIAVHTDKILRPIVQPPNPTITAGDTVHFTATVSDPAGGTPAFTWDFGDDRPIHGASASFTYAAVGTYTATVTVQSQDGSGSTSVRVTVSGPDAAPTTPTPTTTGTPQPGAGAVPKGPAKAQGKTPGKKTGTAKTPASGAKGGGTKPAATSSPSETATPSPSPTSSPAPTPTPTATPTPSPTSGGSANAAGTSPANGSGSVVSRSGGAGRKKPKTPETLPVRTATGLKTVTGLLVSDVIPLSAAQSPLVQDTAVPRGSAPAERQQESSGAGVLAIAGASLAVLAILALGAAGELGVRWRALAPRRRAGAMPR